MKRPLCTIGFSALCALAVVLRFSPSVWLCVGAGALLIWGITLFIVNTPLWVKAVLLSTAVACIYATGFYALFTHPLLRQDGKTLPVEGIVLTRDISDSRTVYEVKLHRAGEHAAFSTRLRLYDYGGKIPLEPGSGFTASVRLFSREDVGGLSKGVPLGGFLQDDPMPARDSSLAFLYRLRETVEQYWQKRLPNVQSDIVAGILNGSKNRIAVSVLRQFRAAGLSHMLAVSGLHLTLFAAMVSIPLKRLIPKLRDGLLCLLILGFMAFELFSVSVMRAGFMLLLLLVAGMVGRRADPWNSLGFALLLILLSSPYAAGDVGLQLSVGATMGIFLFSQPMRRFLEKVLKKLFPGLVLGESYATIEKEMPGAEEISGRRLTQGAVFSGTGHWLIRLISVSVSASLGVLPVSLWHFGEASVLSPFTAVPVAVLTPVILFCSLMSQALSHLSLDALARLFTAWNGLAVWLLQGTAQLASTLPFALLYRQDVPVLLGVLGLLAGVFFAFRLQNRITLCRLAMLGCGLVMAGSLFAGLLLWHTPRLSFPDGNSSGTVLLRQRGETLVVLENCTADTAFLLLDELKSCREKEIDALFLLGEDWGDAVCCEEILESTQVNRLYLSQEAPLFSFLEEPMRQAQAVYELEGSKLTLQNGWSLAGERKSLSLRLANGYDILFSPWDASVQGDWIVTAQAPRGQIPADTLFILPAEKGEGIPARQTVLREEGEPLTRYLRK